MKELEYLLKVGELTLKGGNLAFFERKLKENVKRKLRDYDCSLSGKNGRYYVSVSGITREKLEKVLFSVFGVVGFAEVTRTDKDMETIKQTTVHLTRKFLDQKRGTTFKIEARRSDKGFALNSYQIASELGQHLRESFPELTVDVHNPDWILNVEIREKAVLYGPTKHGPGGLPVGTAGQGILLLSGGIDSPVAGYLMAKRGLRLKCIYFHTYPYTSHEVLEKVETVVQKLSPYLGGTVLFTVPFTDVQVKIKRNAYDEQVTLMMRACMMRIANITAEKNNGLCLITGESLSQVASQTPESLRFTQSTSRLPVFRPLIGMDKQEIISTARTIETYETSILPYEDCCTVFSPKHPVIRPEFDIMKESYEELDIEKEIQDAVSATEQTVFPDQFVE